MNTLNILDLRGRQVSIFDQLQLEEALLRADDRNWCLINQGGDPTIVLGISGKEEELIDLERAEGIPLVRRFSGGGTVITDRDTLFVTFLGDHKVLSCPPYPEKIMQWTEPLYRSVIPGLHLRENDYCIGARKVGGNAQSLTKNRWLHHTTFLWDYDPCLMNLLKMPARKPEYRKNRDHTDFLTVLNSLFGSAEEFLQGVEKQLSRRFKIVPADLSAAKEALSRPHRKRTQQKACQMGLQ